MIKILFTASMAVLLHFAMQAQSTLTLDQAISIGLKNNFDIQIEHLNVETAKKNNTWGMAGAFPTISFDLNQYNNIIQRKPATPYAVPGNNIANGVFGQIDAQFVLFNGFAVRVNKKRLNQLEQLSQGNAAIVIENTLKEIILAYYKGLMEKERLRILKESMVFSKERYNYVQLKKELGSAIPFDVLQEQGNYLTDSANVLKQNIIYKKSLRQLAFLLNEGGEQLYVLRDTLRYQHEAYDFEMLRAKMIASNTNLRNQYTNQEILRYNTKMQQAGQFPKLTLNLGVNGSVDLLNAEFSTFTGNQIEHVMGNVNRDPNSPVYRTVDEIALLRQTQQGDTYGGYGNIGLQFPLFNGRKVKRAIEQARIQEKIAILKGNQLKQSLKNDLLVGYDLYNLKSQLATIAQIKMSAVQLSLDLASTRYRNGALSAIDLRIIQENARNVALENYKAIFESIAARIELIRLTGGMIDNFSSQN